MTPRAAEWRWYHGALARFMASAEGYVMARRRGCMPFVVPRNDWEKCEREWDELTEEVRPDDASGIMDVKP